MMSGIIPLLKSWGKNIPVKAKVLIIFLLIFSFYFPIYAFNEEHKIFIYIATITLVSLAGAIVWFGDRVCLKKKYRYAKMIRAHKDEIQTLEGVLEDDHKKVTAISDTLNKIAKHIEDEDKKKRIIDKINQIEKCIEGFQDTREERRVWAEARNWLLNRQTELIDSAVNLTLKEFKYLRNFERGLDSKDKINLFKKDIEHCLSWIVFSLEKGDGRISLNSTLRKLSKITQKKAYFHAFQQIKVGVKKINESRKKDNPSPEATKVILKFIDRLIHEY